MSNNTAIRGALIGAIAALNLPYAIKWPNKPILKAGVAYTPNNEVWLRVTPIFGESLQIALAKTDKINGILQIDVFMPKDSGDLLAHQISDTIRNALPINGEKLTNSGVSVQFEYHKIGTTYTDGTWYVMPLESKFYAFVDRTA